MQKIIVLDLETQKSFQEVGGRGKNHLLKISVCGIYSYHNNSYATYEEAEIPKLGPIIQTADLIVGYNIKSFDFEVLQPYLNFDLREIPALDLLEEITNKLGRRVKLESVAQGTLGKGKSGNGLEAILYYRNGKMDLLKKYCLDDVRITKQIYDYAIKNQKILFRDYFVVKEVPLSIEMPSKRQEIIQQQEVLF